MKIFFSLIFSLCLTTLFCQQTFYMKGKIDGYGSRKIAIQIFNGNKSRIIDSTRTDTSGSFTFLITDRDYIGLYRIKLERERKIDLVFNLENISFRTNISDLSGSMKITGSKENEIYYNYLKVKIKNDEKLNLLNPLILNYPKDEPFYKKTKTEFVEIQKNQEKYASGLIKSNPGKWMINLIMFQMIPVMDPETSDTQQAEFLKNHYLDFVSLNDSTLLNSDLLPSKIISFLSLFMNRENSPQKQETEFKKAVDLIMLKAKGNDKIYSFVFSFLMNGFEQISMDKIMAYLIDHYEPGKSCLAEYDNDNLEKRIENFKKLAIGKKAPEIQFKDINGNLMNLSDIKTSYKLLIFWYTDCPHCRHLMPIIYSIYNNQKTKNFEVAALSIDTNTGKWLSFVKANNWTWINSCDGLGWDGKAAKSFSLYSTPGIFLIDKNGLIAGKPTNEKELRSLLKEKGLL